MFLFEKNALATITPNFDKFPDHLTRFRWNMHVALPFPFPSRTCFERDTSIADREFSFSIHNHLDRVFIGRRDNPGNFKVVLLDRHAELPPSDDQRVATREVLFSVAQFSEKAEAPDPNEAYAGADGKIKGCMDYLATFLSACQRSSPYLTAWLFYPISYFDIGTIYHGVHTYCAHQNKWTVFSSSVAISLARQLQHALFFFEPPDDTVADSPVDAANELLAEGLMSAFRSMPRLTIINSYTAVESLANVVFKEARMAQLLSSNVPKELAEELAEEQRQRHKTEPSFLFHSGPKATIERSLLEENKGLYDALVDLQKLRHRVAHAGYRPNDEEARAGHKTACEAVQWLCRAANLPDKPLMPPKEESLSGFSFVSGDPHAMKVEAVRMLAALFQAAIPPSHNGGTG